MEHMEVRDSPGKGLFSTNTYGFYKRNLSHFYKKNDQKYFYGHIKKGNYIYFTTKREYLCFGITMIFL